ncbi:hypothetical protein FNC33_09155 [Francisella tularensis]|uniref:Uncharacterized protein n=1 Tax=Francisella tularensis TaxID=263 RepID=A0A6I4RYL9_FRATU|nr:hypothetical protein [Francisella tularensis]
MEFNHNGAKDFKEETKQNFSIKISRLYEYIQAIIKFKQLINRQHHYGAKLYYHIDMLELEIIKKFIRIFKGYLVYSNDLLNI